MEHVRALYLIKSNIEIEPLEPLLSTILPTFLCLYECVGRIWLYLNTVLDKLGLNFNRGILMFIYREVLLKICNKILRNLYHFPNWDS